jgi:hypothetical protein
MCSLCDEAKQDIKRPWTNDPVNVALPAWETFRDKMEVEMNAAGIGDYIIDEIALMFDYRARVGDFIMDAVEGDGVKLFNHAFDKVSTWPFNTRYEVEYFFLETRSTMRVECMAIKDGLSPLHSAVASHMTDLSPMSVVHMSFKVADMDEFETVQTKLDEYSDATLVQFCTSTYGAFAYWHLIGETSGVYLKPRVNLRDQTTVHENAQEMFEFLDKPEEPDRGEFGMPGLGLNIDPYKEHE